MIRDGDGDGTGRDAPPLLQMVFGDDVPVDHGSHDPLLPSLLQTQNPASLEQLLGQLLQSTEDHTNTQSLLKLMQLQRVNYSRFYLFIMLY